MISWLTSIFGRSLDYSTQGILSNSTYNNMVFNCAGVIAIILACAMLYMFVSILCHIFRGK